MAQAQASAFEQVLKLPKAAITFTSNLTRPSISCVILDNFEVMAHACGAKETGNLPSTQVLIAYGLFALAAGSVWHIVADGNFSAVLTVAVMLQCLGTALLSMQVLVTGSASGVSAKSLAMDLLALCFRLSSTLWLHGYLPVDASGDFIFQAIDVCSLGILSWLLYHVLVVKRRTYQEDKDSLSIAPLVFGSIFLAILLHGNMNSRPLFDTFWMAGLFLSTVAVLPQLWLITRTGGQVEALTSHYIAAMAASRALSGLFMWHARSEIGCEPWIGSFNHASWAILGSHALHLLLLCDFGFYYVKAVIAQGLACRIDIPEACDVV
mmetsp:Transcript_124812/g.216483  ORF Transcript_124812/g.216483 Transcript_124812/m.216483 type:complete len:323 (-) Transcript_124812:117-1085(-)